MPYVKFTGKHGGRTVSRPRKAGRLPLAVIGVVGSHLRQRRTLLGVSKQQLGQAAGLTVRQIETYERGTIRIPPDRLFVLSRVLGLQVDPSVINQAKPTAASARSNPKVASPAAVFAPPGSRGAQLVTALLDAEGHLAVDRVAERFGMSKTQLAETIGLPRETLYRRQRAQASRTQARATEMLEIVGRIAEWAGGEKQAMAWYRAEPIPAFGGRTAESLVKDGKAAAVRDYLDHVATGGFA